MTTGKALVLTVLAALTLVGCGGDDGPPYIIIYADAGADGPQTPEVEVTWGDECKELTPDATIKGWIDESFNEAYYPSEVQIWRHQTIRFVPYTGGQNMESGINGVKDGRFHTPQGITSCLTFHVADTYPFFMVGSTEIGLVKGFVYAIH